MQSPMTTDSYAGLKESWFPAIGKIVHFRRLINIRETLQITLQSHPFFRI